MSSVDLSPEERAKIVAERADVRYGPFASLHEAYGVLAEELWELKEARRAAYQKFFGKSNWDEWCKALSDNDLGEFMALVGSERSYAKHTAHHSEKELVVAEAIDVIAVCDRIIAQWGDAS